MLVDVVKLVLFPSLMAFAASSDLFTMTISNKLSLMLAAGFVGLAVASGMSSFDFATHLLAGAVMLVATFTLYVRGWVGGGDAKLAAATALWFGFDQLFDYVLYASLFGGALTLMIVRFRELPLPVKLSHHEWLARLHRSDVGVPYGIALAIAALALYPSSIWMKSVGA
jgi:prepilin peptidase CpaA